MKTVDGGEYGTQKDAQKQAAIGKGKMIRTHSDKTRFWALRWTIHKQEQGNDH